MLLATLLLAAAGCCWLLVCRLAAAGVLWLFSLPPAAMLLSCYGYSVTVSALRVRDCGTTTLTPLLLRLKFPQYTTLDSGLGPLLAIRSKKSIYSI